MDCFEENKNTIKIEIDDTEVNDSDNDNDIDEMTFAQLVIHEFINKLNINPRHEYKLGEMKIILSDVFKSKKKIFVKDEKNNNPLKRKLSTYNIYVKLRMRDFGEEYPDVPSRNRMSMIAKEWRSFSNEEKEEIKIDYIKRGYM